MELNFLDFPNPNSKEFILILHGLFGSSKNWTKVAQVLQKNFNVFCLDARNHGDSPHSKEHTLQEMSQDLKDFIDKKNIDHPILLGHSMGGLTCMYFALNYPKRPQQLIIIDTAPRNYNLQYEKEIESLEIDFSKIKTRKEMDNEMKKLVPNSFIRGFLQMNIARKQDGFFYCKINTQALKKRNVGFQVSNKFFDGKIDFIIGDQSPFFNREDEKKIQTYFSNYTLHFIKGGEHYIQSSHFQELILILDHILKR